MARIIKTAAISALAAFLGATALPVHGYFQSHSFFNPETKYREWFHVTRWPGDARAPRAAATAGVTAVAAPAAAAPDAERYPYPSETFVMTEAIWRKSKQNVEAGVSDWYDTEVVRQRAELEEHPPAMDFLAWMYEHGQGIKQDYRKAFMWYERAKLAGETALRGASGKIFERLTPPDQVFAQVQLADDVKRMQPEAAHAIVDFKQINMRVFQQRRGEDFYRDQNERQKRLEPRPIHR
ncbi:MAG: sel1 repeat family protein [Rhodospirillales bacterium]|nr:sel1 repeat family protein [Rhodospirillales bacterium]